MSSKKQKIKQAQQAREKRNFIILGVTIAVIFIAVWSSMG